MKLNLRIVCAALLAATAVPAWALQLGQIQVKSALNQPLVAAIPLHPGNLTELEGLTVALAPAGDYTRAGLQLTPTDQTLRFHVVTDNNGQKLILVTSSEPITDPYLDFLVQVNTRQGKQVREFVVLLNPVISAPAPAVQSMPVAAAPAPQASAQQAELPPASAFAQSAAQPAPQPAPQRAPQPVPQPAPQPVPPPVPQPVPQPAPQPVPQPAPQPVPQPAPQPAPIAQPLPEAAKPAAASTAGQIGPVERGSTLYHLATEASRGTGFSVNQMMLAMLAANPDAFINDNVSGLKAGAILRIPTRDEVDRKSLAQANTEVRRQYEAWHALKPRPATMVAGAAAEAAAHANETATQPAESSAHLSLVPPSETGVSGADRAGVKGGSGSDTVTGLQHQLQNDRSSLASLEQSNVDLGSRVRSLKDIADKSDKLLSLKDATVAELQRKLAEVQASKPAASASMPVASVAVSSAPAAASSAAPAAKGSAPATKAANPAQAWLQKPLAWIVAGVVLLVLILLGLFMRRRGTAAAEAGHGPLPDPEDVVRGGPAAFDDEEAELHADLADHPDDPARHLALCRFYYGRHDVAGFLAAAEVMHATGIDPEGVAWREVLVMGRQLAPHNALFAEPAVHVDDPYGFAAMRQSAPAKVVAEEDATVMAPVASRAPVPVEPVREAPVETGPLEGDSVDTKLDLARAYLDMGDAEGARSMLEEVLREGSQMQQDEARRLLAEVSG